MDELAIRSFAADLRDAQAAVDGDQWTIEHRGGLEAWVRVAPKRASTEWFVARLFWTDYPGTLPPSVKFIDPESGALGVPSAWPVAAGFRPPTDICTTWTAEGFGLHGEWLSDPSKQWDASGNPLLASVRILQHVLDCTFEKRFAA